MKESLAPFDVYDYLNHIFFSNSSLPYLLVDKEVYRKANVEHPVRNTFFGVALTSAGSVSVKVATQEYTLTQKSIILLGQGLIAQWEIESDRPERSGNFAKAGIYRCILFFKSFQKKRRNFSSSV